MTLVLSLATPHFAIQVSDRRLTTVGHSGQRQLYDDNTNKLTLFSNRMVFGYTGLAFLESKKTDVWLAITLAEVSNSPLPQVLEHLKDRATEVFKRLPYSPETKRHAFIGVGWMSKDAHTLQPVLCRVSNYHDDRTEAPKANEVFSFGHKMYEEPPGWGWLETGARLRPQEITRLTRSITKCAKKGTGPRPVLRHLMDPTRSVAASDYSVGKSLLAVLIPRGAAYSDSTFVQTGANWGALFATGQEPPAIPASRIESIYITPEKYDAVEYGPNLVSGGFAMTGLQMRPAAPT